MMSAMSAPCEAVDMRGLLPRSWNSGDCELPTIVVDCPNMLAGGTGMVVSRAFTGTAN